MKTQISKESHRPAKRYSGIYEQQGRMLTDADWGELMELVKQRLNDALHDVINTGAPRERGVEITKDEDGLLQIKGTHLYADGVKAIVAPEPKDDGSPGDTPFTYDKQADFPNPPALPLPVPLPGLPSRPVYIYGDVWERPVIALEDIELLDPALHGADTCTRTQTMAQIKWCLVDKDPEGPEDNPKKGNARVTVSLHAKLTETDPCDPCADVVAPETRIGNYLFRVEVHDVKGPADAPDEFTLKWSSENGAEQHAVEAVPDDFKNGDWVWEIYDLTSEKHLGVHLVDGFVPQRGELVTSFPENTEEEKYVRRWDGYVVLQRQADGTYVPATDADGGIIGKDKNAQLSVSADLADKSHGAVLSGEVFKVNLESLTLTVELEAKTVVAGDYWLAVVRESIHAVGATVLEAAEPLGILHHYIKLAELNADGILVESNEWKKGSKQWRKLNFPPLTDIDAGDVGYETECPSGLFNEDHDTVKKALDQICKIDAEHVAFEKPCDTSLYKGVSPESINTVAKAMALLCDVRAEHVAFEKPCDTSLYKGVSPESINTVAKAMALLCDVRADQISYQAEEECKLLKEAKTVKEALDLLCARPTGGGCKVAVGDHGEFPTIQKAIETLIERKMTDFNLCLLPGEHVLPSQEFFKASNEKLEGHFSLSLCGSGMESTFLIVEKPTTLKMHSFCSQNLTMVCNERTNLKLRCEQINFKHIHFDAAIMDSKTVALILNGHEQVHVADCIIMAHGKTSFELPQKVFGGIDILEKPFSEDVVIVRTTFVNEARELSMYLAHPDQAEERRTMAKAVSEEIKEYELTAEETESYIRLVASLNQTDIDVKLLARRLAGDLDRVRFAAASAAASRDLAVAVRIPTAGADCLFDHNDIIGQFNIYGIPTPKLPQTGELEKLYVKRLLINKHVNFKSTQCKLELRNNHLTQMLVGKHIIDLLLSLESSGGMKEISGLFETVFLSDNVFRNPNNYFVARGHSFTATRFDHEPAGEVIQPAGIVIGDNAVYVGTVGKSKNVEFEGDHRGAPVVDADIKLFDTTRRQGNYPTDSATFRLAIV